jgi:hypothetical protein
MKQAIKRQAAAGDREASSVVSAKLKLALVRSLALLSEGRTSRRGNDSSGGYPKSSGYPERGRCMGKQTLSVADKRR